MINLTTKKNKSAKEIKDKAEQLLALINTKSSVEWIKSVKSTSVIKSISSHNKKKGHFAFTMSSNSESN